MTPRKIRAQVVLERIAWIRGMLDSLQRLPARDLAAFLEDERTPAAAESRTDAGEVGQSQQAPRFSQM